MCTWMAINALRRIIRHTRACFSTLPHGKRLGTRKSATNISPSTNRPWGSCSPEEALRAKSRSPEQGRCVSEMALPQTLRSGFAKTIGPTPARKPAEFAVGLVREKHFVRNGGVLVRECKGLRQSAFVLANESELLGDRDHGRGSRKAQHDFEIVPKCETRILREAGNVFEQRSPYKQRTRAYPRFLF